MKRSHKFALQLGALVVAMGAAELTARLVGWYPAGAFTSLRYEVDARSGPFALPSQTAYSRGPCFEVPVVRTNRFGMRDRERSLSATGGRLAMVGGSYLQGLQVADEETVSRQLEGRLGGDIEVLNFGVASAGTSVQLLSYRRRIRPFHPDGVVLLFFPGSDVADNVPELKRRVDPLMATLSPYLLLDEAGRLRDDPLPGQARVTPQIVGLLDGTTLGQLAYQAVNSTRLQRLGSAAVADAWGSSGDGAAMTRSAPGEKDDAERALQERAWSITLQGLGRLAREVAADQARFGLVVIPMGDDLALDTADPVARLQAVARQERFPLLDLASYFRRRRPGLRAADLRHDCDGHWSARGHAETAAAIAEFLHDQGWI